MSSSQTHDLHRALLRPTIIHTLRAAGFHSTKPSVLDTLVNLAERYILLLASTTAKQALNSHNDPVPTISDLRLAMQECGTLIPVQGAAEENWEEVLRRPVEELGRGRGQRGLVEKRKREEEDAGDLRRFLRWFDEREFAEVRRVAGLVEESSTGAGAVVGVGGGVVQAEDFLSQLKKRQRGAGAAVGVDEGARFQGTVLGRQAEERPGVVIEGGPVQGLVEWAERIREIGAGGHAHEGESGTTRMDAAAA
ncbi:hypothetical protein LTR37_008454 [Vermiconidia calcicola]|uniref:Uncharacterized protein n=1 Tax=Vermiconidia calcicola TaxID=1690605 RepID=A0ACC3NBY7_9PEZI|nr:hypothetical protein LTR37_008454 [Vermiconidia calcicola]